MTYLSPGVYIQEIDNSAIVPTVSNSVAYFAGNFTKGVIEQPFVITNKSELETYFGRPTNKNYNEWFQCSKFLDYSNQLVVTRSFTELNKVDSKIVVNSNYTIGSEIITDLFSNDMLYKGTIFSFSSHTESIRYQITKIDYNVANKTYDIEFADTDGNNLLMDLQKLYLQVKQ